MVEIPLLIAISAGSTQICGKRHMSRIDADGQPWRRNRLGARSNGETWQLWTQ
jgi:hypothetical protein